MKKLFIGSDHGGFELKQKVKAYLAENFSDIEVEDLGCDSTDSVDYPRFGTAVAEAVVENSAQGIVICGSGVGISIAANRVAGCRAVLANSVELATLGRQHNGANVLAMGGRTQFIDNWQAIVKAFLTTETDMAERHVKRRCLLDCCGA
ncbi:ribose-5-phosphate isomerase [bacterium DOLZORAL124_38_8]|nr:MAG: ribose-5-phosphate isomerase [bacterium DOLZORAL124_38_8]